jgi:hypothetical protein
MTKFLLMWLSDWLLSSFPLWEIRGKLWTGEKKDVHKIFSYLKYFINKLIIYGRDRNAARIALGVEFPTCIFNYLLNLVLAKRFKLTPASAA